MADAFRYGIELWVVVVGGFAIVWLSWEFYKVSKGHNTYYNHMFGDDHDDNR